MENNIERTLTNTTKLQEEEEEIHLQKNTLRPKKLDEYIGQKHITKPLSVFIEAAKKRQSSLDHVLLFGPPGLGKTTLAQIIAFEMEGKIKQTSGPTLEKAGDLASMLTNLEKNDILFIDEIHRLSPNIEEILYPAMEDYQIDIMIGEGPSARSIKLDLPPFTLVGATTRAGALSSPFRDRFGIINRLEFYSPEDLTDIIQRSAKILNVSIENQAALTLAKRSRGTPRIANRLLRRIRDYSQIHSQKIVNSNSILETLKMLGIDQQGFDHLDRKYINALINHFDCGPVGLGTLSASIGEEKTTVEDVMEPFLLQQGYIHRTAQGRIATEKLKKLISSYIN